MWERNAWSAHYIYIYFSSNVVGPEMSGAPFQDIMKAVL